MQTQNNTPTPEPKPVEKGLVFDLERAAKRTMRNGKWIVALVLLCNIQLAITLISVGNQNQAYRLALLKQMQMEDIELRLQRIEKNKVCLAADAAPALKE